MLLLGLLGAPVLSAQSAPEVWLLPAGASVIAKLRTSIDTRYTVEKSSVVAVVLRDVKLHGHVLVPKGTQLLGKVVLSHPAQKGLPAALEVQFQQALLADGDTLPLAAGISSVFTRASRAALDRSNGIGATPAAPPDNGPGTRTPLPYHGGSRIMPMPETTVAPDLAASPAVVPHAPGGLHDSDGVPLQIEPPPNGAGAGTILIGSGPTIRLDAGTRIEVQVRHSVPVPESARH